MMKYPKLIAFFLPQFHQIPENDLWWGEGFTEWSNTRKAKPLFKNHMQPHEPLEDNYYSLLDIETHRWQADLAKKYGIYGFCYYHYWFNGKKLLERPMELLLNNADIDIHYCISWANETWARTWSGKRKEILIQQQYGNRDDWEAHLQYLLPFFRDRRYIKIEGKLLFILYRAADIKNCGEMITYWNKRLKEIDMPELYVIETLSGAQKKKVCTKTQASLEFEPMHTVRNKMPFYMLKREAIGRLKLWKLGIYIKLDYEKICKKIVKRDTNAFPGFFPTWDNTPRMGKRAMIITGSNIQLYKKYLRLQCEKAMRHNREFVFINAWNEWGEGAHLEPDQKNGYGYLKATKSVLSEIAEETASI